MNKKILAGLLALCMLICMLPVVTLAAEDLATIDGVAIADGATVNGATLNGNTLTLNGVTAENITLSASVTKIVVVGINNFTFSSAEAAIWADGDLTISGSGILNINDTYSYGIYAEGKVVVEGVSLTIDSAAIGVYSNETGAVSNVTVPTPTFMYDFTKPTGKVLADGVTPDIGLGLTGGILYDTDLSKGYFGTTVVNNDPWFHMSTYPTVAGKDMAYMVIKYANSASLIDQAAVMYNGGDNGLAWGDIGAEWRWETCDGSWDVMTVWDGKDITADGETVTSSVTWATSETAITDFRLDCWNNNVLYSGAFNLAYIAFFATQADAEAYAAAEKKKLEIEAASGITADKVFTQGGKYYTADTVIALQAGATAVELSGAPAGRTGIQTCCDNVLIDDIAKCTSNADSWLSSNNIIDMTGKSTVAIYGWMNGDVTSITKLGYQIGDTITWIDADTSVSNAAANGTHVATNPIFYDAELAAVLGESARRYYIEIPVSAIPDGITGAAFVAEMNGTTVLMNNYPTFYLQKNAPAYSANGIGYNISGNNLIADGKDCGLDLVTDGSNNWAVGGKILEVTANGTTYSHGNYTETGYYVGTPYIIKVTDANGNGYNGATVKMYNEQGNVIARATTAAGEATLYAPCTANYIFSVEGDFATKTGITATDYTATVKLDVVVSVADIKAVTIASGAVVTISNAEYAILTASGEQSVVLENAALNADVDTIVAAFNGIEITGASVSVGETFALNLFLSGALNGSSVVVDGKTYPVTYVNGEYMATINGITPQTIADQKNIAVVDVNGNTQDTLTYSVKENLVNLYNKSTSSVELKNLIAALLNYSAAAQIYTNYNTSNLANADGLTGAVSVPTSRDDYMELTESTKTGYTFTAATVYYNNTNKLCAVISATDISKVTVTINGEQATIVKNAAGQNVVYTDSINANQFADEFLFIMCVDGVEVQTLNYSVNTYAYRMCNGSSANAVLAKALYNYGVTAAAYMNA